jgi:hypothetical protein
MSGAGSHQKHHLSPRGHCLTLLSSLDWRGRRPILTQFLDEAVGQECMEELVPWPCGCKDAGLHSRCATRAQWGEK